MHLVARAVYTLIVTSCFGPGFAQAEITDTVGIVGVWELARFDNLRPQDAPDEVANLTYIFYPDGKLVYFVPGGEVKIPNSRNNLPFKDHIPYQLKGSNFEGFLGLTNDLNGRATVNFPTEKELEVNYPDGSVALLSRISVDPRSFSHPKLRCIPFTVRGHNYNKDYIEKARIELRSASVNTDMEKRLLGTWRSYSDDPNRLVATLDFREGKELVVTLTWPNSKWRKPFSYSGVFTVRGDYLISNRQCGSPERVWFEGDELRLTFNGMGSTSFRRVNNKAKPN